jgi:hypothetical protein
MLATFLAIDGSTKKTLLELATPFVTLVAVFVGFILNELSYFLRVRREDRRSIGQALSTLLEIRHRLQAIPAVIDALKQKTSIPPEAELAVSNYYASFLPDLERLQDGYNKAVDVIAGPFPVLAFRLRSKDQFDPLLRQLRSIIPPGDRAAAAFYLSLETKLLAEATSALNTLIIEMATQHGWLTWIRVRRQLREKAQIPEGILAIPGSHK